MPSFCFSLASGRQQPHRDRAGPAGPQGQVVGEQGQAILPGRGARLRSVIMARTGVSRRRTGAGPTPPTGAATARSIRAARVAFTCCNRPSVSRPFSQGWPAFPAQAGGHDLRRGGQPRRRGRVRHPPAGKGRARCVSRRAMILAAPAGFWSGQRPSPPRGMVPRQASAAPGPVTTRADRAKPLPATPPDQPERHKARSGAACRFVDGLPFVGHQPCGRESGRGTLSGR